MARTSCAWVERFKKMGRSEMKGRGRLATYTLLVIAVLCLLEVMINKAGAELSAAACKEERWIGLNACKPVIYGKLPPPECCERVRVSHGECLCADVTPILAALIDVDRAVRLIEGCGRRVPRHYKCGSIITP
ncbi:hypothetical protein Tsubulata_019116 [Turnera subulata]|uniref:Bifunctional inhibitor/plant lipid transfer protein/seed storage helical domain-containing protein n=1 Tax=Turnera subulata TaxID=218843 RepID=A0A9Q0JPI5_9ROSI|nr:hypothetical protein Tsubulata_019116 [Turnera subulata]